MEHGREPTFLSGTGRPGLAVHALELVEVGADLDVVDDALLEAREDHAALRGHLDVLGLPGSWGGQARRLPEQDPVALDELGLAVHLRSERTGARLSARRAAEVRTHMQPFEPAQSYVS